MMPHDPQDALLDAREVAAMIAVNPRTVPRLSRAGRLPPPVTTSPRFVRWRRSDVERWIADGCPRREAP